MQADTFLPRCRQRGFSLLEFLLALLIFAFAIVPLFVGSMSGSRTAQSTGKHLMAAQVAQDLLEYLRGMPYRDCIAEAGQLAALGRQMIDDQLGERLWVINDDVFNGMVDDADRADGGGTTTARTREEFMLGYRQIAYTVRVEEVRDTGSAAGTGRMALLEVTVSYPVDDTNPDHNRQEFKVAGVKYREDL